MTRVTGLGSLPGVDAGAAARLVFEATPELPYLPELPGRGPWAGLIGRGAALLSGLPTEFTANEWRLSATPGVDGRRARQTLRDDLDLLEENAQGYAGPFKVQVVGPWTLSASVWRPLGGRVLGDRGARTDIAQSLAAGVDELLSELRRRLPALELRLQVDEPSLPAVLAGRVPTEGGYFRHRAVSEPEVAEALSLLTALGPPSLVHSCAPDVPIELLTRPGRDGAGFGGIALDASLVDPGRLDAVAALVERGGELFWGVAASDGTDAAPDPLARRTLAALRPLDLGPALADGLWLTPTCGLAGAAIGVVPRAFEALRRASAQVDDALRG